ncbi:MAG: DUF424 family protein [Methanomassiliicoccales archaeon]|nr:DUF424 family protein [Methanomassiliicoccales archaeon]
MITVRVYRRGSDTLVAACDKDLLGKTFREGELRLEVTSFYEGEDADEEMLLNRLSFCTVANLVGKKTVGIATKHKLINDECVISIDGVPHVQLVKM